MQKGKDQVALSKLVFTHNWEDPGSDQAALKIGSGDHVFAITSGACNVLGFLLYDPEVIYSVDINPAQSRILELKIAAIRARGRDLHDFGAGLRHVGEQELLAVCRPAEGVQVS